MGSRIRAVFFDAGHTLLHPHPDLGSVYAEVTARFGVRLPPERFAEAVVPVFREFLRGPGREAGAGDAEDYAMWRRITREVHARLGVGGRLAFDPWFEALYRRFGEPGAWRLYGDVEGVLEVLRGRGLTLGVVSNWDTRLRGIASGLGLDRKVDFLVISAEAGVRKPDPRIFEAALRRAGVGAGEAAHVGDLPEEDGEGALRAGLRAFLVDRGGGFGGGGGPAGVPVLRSLEELVQLV